MRVERKLPVFAQEVNNFLEEQTPQALSRNEPYASSKILVTILSQRERNSALSRLIEQGTM